MDGENDTSKIAYLQLIQEPICRMSTISAIFKGFTAAIVAGISAIAYGNISILILALSFVPVISFALLDVYYLKLERKLRFLYEQVRKNRHVVDFSLALTDDTNEVIAAKANTWACIKSPSICAFYSVMILIPAIVLIFKICGLI